MVCLPAFACFLIVFMYIGKYTIHHQGTIGCTPNNVPMVFIVFDLGILGDEITHKYPRDIGRI